MGNSDFDADRIAQLLQVMFENVFSGRVASATIADNQYRCCVWVTLLANPVPVPAEAVAGKFSRIVSKPDVDMPPVGDAIVNPMWNDNATCPLRVIMVKALKRCAASCSAFAVQGSQMLFGFGIHGKPGISQRFVLLDQFGNTQKLWVAIRMLTTS